MSTPARRPALFFAGIGHFYIHLFTAFYFTIVLSLETDWRMAYHELIDLWWLGGLLVGVAALPAGRLADRWSATGMMVVYFVGLGLSSIVCGFVSTPAALLAGLASIGLFAAIYHPVGIPWVIRNASAGAGKALAFNGLFGSLGAAGAGTVAGVLAEAFGWRSAFVIPGAVCFATGLAMLWYWRDGRVADAVPVDKSDSEATARGDRARVFLLLVVSMFVAGIVFHACQAAFPKLFAERLPAFVQGSAFRAGLLVTGVYTVAAFVQLAGGYLADRYALRRVYLLAWCTQVGVLALLSGMAGFGVFAMAILAASVSVAQLPAENMLLARYTPAHHHGLAFGFKFVLAFGATPVAVMLIAWVRSATGDFTALFLALSAAVLVVALLLLALPRERVVTTGTG